MAPIAPPIEGELWLNTEPLTPDHLKGRVVVLVFWSAGCEASLRRLQQVQAMVDDGTVDGADGNDGSPDDVIAVAVHTPRMTCDDDVDRLRRIIACHRITIPVVHDPRYQTWTRYEPQGWPSTAVIDRRGRITGIAAGCHDINLVHQALAAANERPAGRRRADHDTIELPTGASADHTGGEQQVR